MNTTSNNALQVSTVWCQKDIHYSFELIPTFSTKGIVISNSSSVGQTSLTLSSPDIQLNEHYKAILRVEGSTFSQLLDLSTYVTVMDDVIYFITACNSPQSLFQFLHEITSCMDCSSQNKVNHPFYGVMYSVHILYIPQ